MSERVGDGDPAYPVPSKGVSMHRVLGIVVALVSALVIVAPVAQASPLPSRELSSQQQVADTAGVPTIQGWAHICRRFETVGVRHFPGGPAFVQLRDSYLRRRLQQPGLGAQHAAVPRAGFCTARSASS
jgi:hypothetical protein